MAESVHVRLVVNGIRYAREVEPRLLLSDFLRHDLLLTGTHVGCEHGVCGACTILVNGDAMRSCLMFAVQADGAEVTTVEGLVATDGRDLHPLQQAFREAHGLQCGFCTPGILMTLVPFLAEHSSPNDDQIREALAAHLCRCTGYANIVAAVKVASGGQRSEVRGPRGTFESRGASPEPSTRHASPVNRHDP
jgi:aerobic-type carbon monoxide dehydrogenase small subunit (CoxS/CutS family)